MVLTREDVEGDAAAILLCALSADFFLRGWNMGTGGGVSLQPPGSSVIFLTPSGVHKERMQPCDLFAYDISTSEYVYRPAGKSPSASSVLFLWLHEQHGAGAVIHTHSLYANLASRKNESRMYEWGIKDQEYIKGVPDWQSNQMLRNDQELIVPIIENKATEDKLLPDMKAAVESRPEAACILVRNHGAYHFGRDIWKAKSQAECLEYLFELQWKIDGGR